MRQAETYLGEKFTKTLPKARGKWETDDISSSGIKIQRLDHCALEVTDVEKSVRSA